MEHPIQFSPISFGRLILCLTFLSTYSSVQIVGCCDNPKINRHNIIDISSLFDNGVEGNNFSTLNLTKIITKANKKLTLFYETDLNNKLLPKLRGLVDWVEKQINRDKTALKSHEILVSIKYNSTELITSFGSSKSEMEQFGKLRLIKKLSFEYIHHQEYCTDRANILALSNFVQMTKNFKSSRVNCSTCKPCERETKLGYTIRQHNLMNCPQLIENIRAADFVIFNLQFELEQHFIESFSAFKSYMDNKYKEITAFLLRLGLNEKLTFYNLQYFQTLKDNENPEQGRNSRLISGDRSVQNINHKLPVFHLHQSARKHKRIRNIESNADTKYQCLFFVFVQEWMKMTITYVILKPQDLCSKNCQYLSDSQKTSTLTPLIDNLLVSSGTVECNWLRSTRLSINNIRLQGFQSIAISGVSGNLVEIQKTMSAALRECESAQGPNFFNSTGHQEILSGSTYDFYNSNIFNPKNMKFRSEFEAIFGIRLENSSCMALMEHIVDPYFNLQENENSNRHADRSRNLNLHTVYRLVEHCDNIIIAANLALNVHEYPKNRDIVVKNIKDRYFFAESIIKARWPTKRISLQLTWSATRFDDVENEGSLYCSQFQASLSEYFEAIFTWAEIYNIPLILNIYDKWSTLYTSPLTWYKIKADKQRFNVIDEAYPLYIRRGYNSSRIFGGWANGMYPCLNWLDEVPKTGVRFAYRHIGTYLNLNLRSGNQSELTESEFSTILIYTLFTFRVVEITVINQSDISTLFSTLNNADFQQSLYENDIYKREIFLNIHLPEFPNKTELFDTLESRLKNISLKTSIIKVNLHFTSSSTTNDLNIAYNLTKVFSNKSIATGIELTDCESIVRYLGNEFYETEISLALSHYISTKLLDKWSYIVCIVAGKQKVDQSKLQMQTYLETHLYMKKILQIFFPNLQNVYFKMLPSNSTGSSNEKDFNLTLSHLIQFGEGYNISYFLLPAFGRDDFSEFSYWKISNYTDLSKPRFINNYLGQGDREPIIIEKQTIINRTLVNHTLTNHTLKLEVPKIETKEKEADVFWLVFGFVIAVILLATILIVVVVRAKRNAQLLSDKEVQEFLKGRLDGKISCDNNDFNSHLVDCGYKAEFEICKSKITIDPDKILGNGNFGIVYKAKLSQNRDECVAVKMPLKECDKQTFIGMLREVKLLGHLGSHQNLVKFIGCYTKEIQQGVLYIVMECCAGGSLLSHLKSIKAAGQEVTFLDLLLLCRDVASGMAYIASRKVIHGDLSARNVLLDEMNVCKISDFGLSRKLYEYRTYDKKTQEPLPWRWMAYESLANMQFSTMSDVWSFGVTVWEIFSLGEMPYPGCGWTCEFIKELENGMRLTSPKYATSAIYEKLVKCWRLEPNERPDFEELFNFFVALLPYTNIS